MFMMQLHTARKRSSNSMRRREPRNGGGRSNGVCDAEYIESNLTRMDSVGNLKSLSFSLAECENFASGLDHSGRVDKLNSPRITGDRKNAFQTPGIDLRENHGCTQSVIDCYAYHRKIRRVFQDNENFGMTANWSIESSQHETQRKDYLPGT